MTKAWEVIVSIDEQGERKVTHIDLFAEDLNLSFEQRKSAFRNVLGVEDGAVDGKGAEETVEDEGDVGSE